MARVTISLTQSQSFPSVCVCCGAPSSLFRAQSFRLDTPVSAAILTASIMVGGLMWTERTITLSLPVCNRHRKKGRESNLLFFQGTAISIGLGLIAYVISLLELPGANWLAVIALAAIISTVFLAMQMVDDGMKAKLLGSESLVITGVNPKFVKVFDSQKYQ